MLNTQCDLLLVTKPWGFEFQLFDDGAVSIWVVCLGQEHKSGYLLSNQHTSLHLHTRKQATVIGLEGVLSLETQDKAVHISPLDFYTIPPRNPHRVSTNLGYSIALEVETPSHRNDIVRIQDSYGRNSSEYTWDTIDNHSEILWASELRERFDTYSNINVIGPQKTPTLTISDKVTVSFHNDQPLSCLKKLPSCALIIVISLMLNDKSGQPLSFSGDVYSVATLQLILNSLPVVNNNQSTISFYCIHQTEKT